MSTLRLVPSEPTRRPLSRMRTAASAYRADIAARGSDDAFCKNDGIWIAVGSMLSTAANIEDAERAAKIVEDALDLAKEALGAERLARGDHLDPPGRRNSSDASVIRLLAEEAEDLGALNSAALILDAYIAAANSIESLDLGRLVAHQARVARHQGEVDISLARSKEVERLGRAINDDELRVRAWIGYGLVAKQRGNFPVVRRWMSKAGDLAEQAGFGSLGSITHLIRLEAAAKAGDIDVALVHGWTALQVAAGDITAESEALGNLGTLLLTANHPTAAKAVLMKKLTRPVKPLAALASLGSLAMAGAQCNDYRIARWAIRELDRLVEMDLAKYPTAEALADCAEALLELGARSEALSFLGRAEAISKKHGYHELNFRVESLAKRENLLRPAPSILAPRAAGIAGELADMMPSVFPDRVELAMAS